MIGAWAWLGGCSEPESIELVAVRGCGLEQEFSGLCVRVLGDFALGGGTEILLGPGQRGRAHVTHRQSSSIDRANAGQYFTA